MKRKIFMILLTCVLVLGMTTGCSEKKEEAPKDKEVEEKAKGKCEVEECMNLIETNMTVEEVNEIIGFDGEKEEDKEIYTWQLTEKTKIEVEYTDGQGTITATMDKEKIKEDKLKMSICYGIQSSLRNGETFNYEEMVEKLEGIEGHLATKAPTFKRYIWVSKDSQTFGASFSDSLDGKCSIASIR